jgi:PAS domain S-box-containing protein
MDGFLRILVAEENEVDSFVIQCELSKLDMAFTFKRVASLEEYLAHLEEFHPNLVLANNQFDGIAIIHKTRAKFENIPIIMLMQAADEPQVDRLFKHGATDCLFRRQLPLLKESVEKVMKHAREHHGEPVPNPTCLEGSGPERKSFLDRYFGHGKIAEPAAAKAASAPAGKHRSIQPKAPVPVEAALESASAEAAQPKTEQESTTSMSRSFGTKFARIKKKFRASPQQASAEAPAAEEIPVAAAVPAGAVAAEEEESPANPSNTAAGGQYGTAGPMSIRAEIRSDHQRDPELDQVRRMESELVERNAVIERARNELEHELQDAVRSGAAGPQLDDDLQELLNEARGFQMVDGKTADRREPSESSDSNWTDQLQRLNKELRAQMIARKDAEVSLQSSEAAFKALFDSSFLPLFLLDDSGAIMQVNPAACSLLSYSAAELLGRNLNDFTEPENKSLMEQAWSAFLSKGEQKGERRFITANAAICEVEFTIRAGVIHSQHLMVARDISQQKTLKEELSRARQQIGRTVSDQSAQMKKLEELELKSVEFHRKEELWKKSKQELDQTLAEKAHEIKNLTERLKAELAHRQRMEEDIKQLHFQLEKKVNERTSQLEASNNELRLLSRFLQTSREEDRLRLSRIVNEALDQNLTRIQIDLTWVTQRLAQTDEGFPRKQLIDVMNSMETMLGQSIQAVQQLSRELGRWAPKGGKRS